MNALHGFPKAGRGRILHLNRVGHMGGVERVILTLASGLRDRGYDPVIACPPEGDLPARAVSRGLATIAMPIERNQITADPRILLRQATSYRRGSRYLVDYCRSAGVDLIHAHHPVGALYAAKARRELGVPILLHTHEIGPARPLYRLALSRAAGCVDRFVGVSEPCRDLLRSVGIADERIEVIHNGVDGEAMAMPDVGYDPELDGPGPHIGVFGVIEPRKGQDVFLEAAALVAARYPGARFWIVGGLALKDKAAYEARLRAMAARPELEGRVRFAGHQINVASWMRRMDVVALTSVADESLGMVIIEAMTLGRPVVASIIGGTPEIILDGTTGLLVPRADVRRLADAMTRLLSPDSGPDIGRNAQIEALRRFSGNAFAARISDVYTKLRPIQGVTS